MDDIAIDDVRAAVERWAEARVGERDRPVAVAGGAA
jgi:hypothetical protein